MTTPRKLSSKHTKRTRRTGDVGATSRKTVAPKLVAAPRAREAAVAYAIFDGLPNAIMVANRDMTIVYMNRAANELFSRHNELFARQFSGFDASKLVGQSIDQFHKHPGHQRAVLADASRLPHVADIKIGGVVLEVKASVSAIAGDRVVEWADVTEARKRDATLLD